MKEFVCIVCPNGCHLTADDDGTIHNAGCRRGVEFAREEMTAPKRTVCSTAATVFADCPVVPVRTSKEIPKEKVGELMQMIRTLCVDRRMKRGEPLIRNLFGTEADLIVTSDMGYTYFVDTEDQADG